jgi:hypothetical protein
MHRSTATNSTTPHASSLWQRLHTDCVGKKFRPQCSQYTFPSRDAVGRSVSTEGYRERCPKTTVLKFSEVSGPFALSRRPSAICLDEIEANPSAVREILEFWNRMEQEQGWGRTQAVENMVPGGRVELPTPAFSGPRSTGELPRHGRVLKL